MRQATAILTPKPLRKGRLPSGPVLDPAIIGSSREAIEAHVERLIAMLDAADGDHDREPEHDACEFEDAHDRGLSIGDDDDAEPSLGKPEGQAYMVGSTSDLEYSEY